MSPQDRGPYRPNGIAKFPQVIGAGRIRLADGTQARLPTLVDRMTARIVDFALVLSMAIAGQLIFWSNRPASLEARDFELLYQIESFVLFYAAAHLAYETFQHRLWGKTLGKRWLGIRLVSIQRHHEVTWRQAFRRAIFVLPLGITILKDPVHRGFHDVLADSIVVRNDTLEGCSESPASDA